MISRDFMIPTFNEVVADLTEKVQHDHSYSLHPSLKVPPKHIQNKRIKSGSKKFSKDAVNNRNCYSNGIFSIINSCLSKEGNHNTKEIIWKPSRITTSVDVINVDEHENRCSSREGNHNANKSKSKSIQKTTNVDEVIDVDEHENRCSSREGNHNANKSKRKFIQKTTNVDEVIDVDEYENSCLSRNRQCRAKESVRKSFRKMISADEVINVDEYENSTLSKEQNKAGDDLGLLIQKTTEKLNKTSRNNYNLKNSLKGNHNAKEPIRKSARQAISSHKQKEKGNHNAKESIGKSARQAISSNKQKEKGTSILDIIGTIDSMLDTSKKDTDFECEKVDDVISEIFRDKKKNEIQNNSKSPFFENNRTKQKKLSDKNKTIFQTHIKIIGSNIIHSCTNQKETNLENSSNSSQTDQHSRISSTFQESTEKINQVEEGFKILESDKLSEVPITSNHELNEGQEAVNLLEAQKLPSNQQKLKETNLAKAVDVKEKMTNEIDENMDVMDLFRRTQMKLEELKRKNSDMKRNAKGAYSYSSYNQLIDNDLTKNDETNFSIYSCEKETNCEISPGKQLDFEMNVAANEEESDKVVFDKGSLVENSLAAPNHEVITTMENRISLIESDGVEKSKIDGSINTELSKGKLDSSKLSFDTEETERSTTNEESLKNVYDNAEILRLYNKTQYKLNKIKKKNHIFSKQSSETTDNEGLVGGFRRSGRKKWNRNYNFNKYNYSKLNKKLIKDNDDNQDSFQIYDNIDYVQKDHISNELKENENEPFESTHEFNSTDLHKPLNRNHVDKNEICGATDLNAIENNEKSTNRKSMVTRNRNKCVKNASVGDIDFSVKFLPNNTLKHNSKTISVDEVINVDEHVSVIKQDHRKLYNMRRISDQKKSRKSASSNEDVESVSPSKQRVQERIYRLKNEKDSVISSEKFQSQIQSCKNEESARKSARISNIREMLIKRSVIPIKKDFCIKVDDCLCPSNSKKKMNYFDGKVYNMRNHSKDEKSLEIEPSTESLVNENITTINENCNFGSVLSDLDPRNLTSNMKYTNNDITDELDFLGITGMKKIKAIRWDSSNIAGNILPIKSGIVVRNITVENICKFNSIQYSKSVVYQSQFSKLFFDEVNMLLSIYPLTKTRFDTGGVRLKRKRKIDRNSGPLKVTNLDSNEKFDPSVSLSDSKIENDKPLSQNSLQTTTDELYSKPCSSITGNKNDEQTDELEVLQDNDILKSSVVQPSVVDDSSSNDDLPCRKKFATDYGSSPSEIFETLEVHYNSEDGYYNESADLSHNLLKNYPLRKRNIISIT